MVHFRNLGMSINMKAVKTYYHVLSKDYHNDIFFLSYRNVVK